MDKFIATPEDRDLDESLSRRMRNFMRVELAACTDLYFDGCDVNATKLAEAAADHFNAYVDDVTFKVHEDVFDVSQGVAEEYLDQLDESD